MKDFDNELNMYPHFADMVASQKFLSGDWFCIPHEGIIMNKYHRQVFGSVNKGYVMINTNWCDVEVNIMFHRALWIGAHGGIIPDKNLQIDHIDGNPMNNRISNLRLVTGVENKNNPNTKWRRCGVNHPRAKSTAAEIEAIRAESAKGATNASLARKYGRSETAIGRIVRGETYRVVEGANA